MKPEKQHRVHRYFEDEVDSLDKLFKSMFLFLYGKSPKISNTLFHSFLLKFCLLCSCYLKCLVEWKTVKIWIRLPLQEQSDLGLHYLYVAFFRKLWFRNFRTFTVLCFISLLAISANNKLMILFLFFAENKI